ncbi:hypothetical protein SAMD00023353_0203520 [Rosellinia necatrix]|uniref:DUF6546 domain-containing protein n=1 Tax=Rosellinia necatrix TaxID=77044 RepID=A0A1S8A4Z7_ROSNE|nr:hypothetical protein SAMD00023353_0203520 [Rosellinia necatrix]
MPKHSSNFGKAVTRLFSILNTWQPTGRLILELNASSPSDSEHWFKNYCFGPGHEDPGDWSQQEKAIKWHDPKHGWVNGQQVKAPDAPTILRLFSPPCLTPPKNLLEVYAVTGFVIRRQLRHEIFPEVLKALWEKLPRLDSIAYELWRVRRYQCQTACTYAQTTPRRDVYTLLQNASLAALNMPQLKSMVLWNSEQGTSMCGNLPETYCKWDGYTYMAWYMGS